MSKEKSIGPISIMLDDRCVKQLKPLIDAVRAGAKVGKPRVIVGQVVFLVDSSDGLEIQFLTVVCTTHAVGVRYIATAREILNVNRKAKQ